MVIVMKRGTPEEEIMRLHDNLVSLGLEINLSRGESYVIIGLVGDTTQISERQLQASTDYIDRVMRVQHPFKRASRLFQPNDSVIDIDGHRVGDGNILMIAGPCAVESEEQLLTIAHQVKEQGAQILRGGAYKPRTSPYSFQGMEEEGLKILQKAKQETGMPVVTECVSPDTVDLVAEYVDIIQIGTRNMQNFALLKKVATTDKVILLKRGMSATIEELLMAAEYIMAGGNSKVILCERGIRTFETYTRNTLDISAIPAIKELSHLPIIVDPSHAAGKWAMVEPLAKAAIAAGADGLTVEVHHQPEMALSDGAQSLKPEKYGHLVKVIDQIKAINNILV